MRGIGVYIIIVFAVICIWYWLSAGATSNSYTPVSYTHLDVYKRQLSEWQKQAEKTAVK